MELTGEERMRIGRVLRTYSYPHYDTLFSTSNAHFVIDDLKNEYLNSNEYDVTKNVTVSYKNGIVMRLEYHSRYVRSAEWGEYSFIEYFRFKSNDDYPRGYELRYEEEGKDMLIYRDVSGVEHRETDNELLKNFNHQDYVMDAISVLYEKKGTAKNILSYHNYEII